MGKFKRAFVIVLDSYGIGNEPDAADFGDGVCNTLKSIVGSDKYDTPNMKKLGLFNIDGVGCGTPEEKPLGSFARLRELSRGKDTTTGHWEIAGIVSERPMPTYPDGFPADLIATNPIPGQLLSMTTVRNRKRPAVLSFTPPLTACSRLLPTRPMFP